MSVEAVVTADGMELGVERFWVGIPLSPLSSVRIQNSNKE